MKIFTSYFYQIRHFNKNMIPLSTALWDPKWFHESKGNGHIFKDKNGVYNGIRYELFAPKVNDQTQCYGPDCRDDPGNCEFIKAYRDQLSRIPFHRVCNDFHEILTTLNQWEHFTEEPSIVLIVYETPDNPCSERKAIQDWFKDHGVVVEEWSRS